MGWSSISVMRTDPAPGGEPAIEVHGLRKRFGTTIALDNVDLVVETGQVLALLGPNGAGKTTLVRILATLLSADAGTARVAGFDVVGQAGRVRAAIGLTGQFAAIDDLLSGPENLEMVGELSHLPHREALRRARELLEQFELVEAGDRQTRTYSGGMRRRLDLAACLIARPPVVVLDEPTTGLDPASRLGLWQVIDNLAGAGTTVLLTTQYLEEADRLARRIAVIDRGRIVADGSPDEPPTTTAPSTLPQPLWNRSAPGSSTSTARATGRQSPPPTVPARSWLHCAASTTPVSESTTSAFAAPPSTTSSFT
jgi:ABC-2 type transport system ATP-binding protein